MPAQMSHVNKLLVFDKQQQQKEVFQFVPNPQIYTGSFGGMVQKEGISLLSINHHSPLQNLKIKLKIKKGEKSQAPCLRKQQRFTPLLVRSRDGGRDPESQLLWKLLGSPVISEALLHTDTFEHGHLDSLLSWREARLQWFYLRLLPARKTAGLHTVLATLDAG